MNNQIVSKMVLSHTLHQQLTQLDDSIQGLIAKDKILDQIADLEDEITGLVNTYNRTERRLSHSRSDRGIIRS